MKHALKMSVQDAYTASRSSVLADKIWDCKNPDTPIDRGDSEYLSWANSIPYFLEAAMAAGLGELEVIFELPTPLWAGILILHY